MKPRRPQPMRMPLPTPKEVPMLDAMGRRVRGRSAEIRRLYREERCNIDELAAYFGIGRVLVSYALRNKASDRREWLAQHNRFMVRLPYSRDPISREFRRWLRAA